MPFDQVYVCTPIFTWKWFFYEFLEKTLNITEQVEPAVSYDWVTGTETMVESGVKWKNSEA